MRETQEARQGQDGGMVPVAARLRYLALFRAFGVVLAGMHLALESSAWLLPAFPFFVGAVVHTAVTWGISWRMRDGRRRLAVFGGTLLLDGVAIGALVYASGWLSSPLRYLFLLHAMVVALAASYRTGLKLVLWHGLVILVIAEAITVGILVPGTSLVEGDRPLWFIATMIVMVAITASAAWINERELRRNRFDLDALATMATRFEQHGEAADIAAEATRTLAATFDVTRAGLLLIDAGQAVVLGSHHLRSEGSTATAVTDSPILGRVVAARAPLLLHGLTAQDDPWLVGLFPEPGNLSMIPMVTDDAVTAIMILEHRQANPALERRTLDMLQRFTSHIGLALEAARMSAGMRELANRDGLTGLLNRRAMDSALTQEIARSSRSGAAVCLLLLDIDHFKVLNDRHGHLVGDEVLRVLGQVLRQQSRTIDITARFGGEEFVVILPGTDTAEGHIAATRLLRAVATAPTPVPITVSIGVATAQAGHLDGDDLLSRADAALYQAKAEGRNQVRWASSSPIAVTPPPL